MDELNMRHALLRYVSAEPPPFSLAANDLITLGRRRRQRWRASLGSGAAAGVTAAVFATLFLTQGGNSSPVGNNLGCHWQLPIGYWSPPSYPPLPSGSGNTWSPSMRNTFSPTPRSTATPATPMPPAVPPSPRPMKMRGGIPETERLPGDADPARLDEMSCYLKRQMIERFPGYKFRPNAADAPMEIGRDAYGNEQGEWRTLYRTGTYIIDGGRLCSLYIQVAGHPSDYFKFIPSDGVREIKTPRGNTARIWALGEHTTMLYLTTKKTAIQVMLEGRHLLTEAQLVALADAPQLDVYR